MMPRKSDEEMVEELNKILDWLRDEADSETGIAPVVSAEAPGGQQQHRFDQLRYLQLIKFDGRWTVLDFDHEVTIDDLNRIRAARIKTGSQAAAMVIAAMA